MLDLFIPLAMSVPQSSTQSRFAKEANNRKRQKRSRGHKYATRKSLVAPSLNSCKSAKRALKPNYPSPISTEARQSLMTKAQANGSVMVIVGLRVDFKPEGELPSSRAVQSQRQAIARAQKALLNRLSVCKYKVESIKRFDYIPSLAMAVDANTLMHLSKSSDVASISEDVPMSPMSE